MPPKAPPPPRPDPVTLEQIYENIVSPETSSEARAYHIVALQTVAFHASVKLFLFERQRTTSSHDEQPSSILDGSATKRREALLQNIAFFLSIRNSPVSRECRWETVSLLGELCRIEAPTKAASAASGAVGLEEKLNHYAQLNLEFLASLPWFRSTLAELVSPAGTAQAQGEASSTREEAKQRLKERQSQRQTGGEAVTEDDWKEDDEDVIIAMKDILRALPDVIPGEGNPVAVWSKEQREQAQDLLFLDASTSLSHLIPLVARSSSDTCAKCLKSTQDISCPLLRCSACKSVFYCSAECQKLHWATTHRVPCLAYKALSTAILEQFYELNSKKGKKKKQKGTDELVVLEVPLEPSLFYETRRYMYDHRDPHHFSDVSFSDYFMKYNVKGN